MTAEDQRRVEEAAREAAREVRERAEAERKRREGLKELYRREGPEWAERLKRR